VSDKILRALMHLFAIVPQWQEGADGNEMVKLFLKQQLSQTLVEKYLAVFNEYLALHKGDASVAKQAKRTSLNSVKVLRICTDINRELNAKQKYVVLLRLIEFIYSTGAESSAQSFEFAQTVAGVFNISDEEYAACVALVNPKTSAIPDSPLFLKIDGDEDSSAKYESERNTNSSDSHFDKIRISQLSFKHLYHHSLEGELWLVFLKSAGIFFVRYSGEEPLTINGQPFSSRTIQVFSQGSVIRGAKTEPVYYSDAIHCFMDERLQTSVTLEARDLEFRFANGETGIHDLSFAASSGQMVAIMGGSGAGKSTLLNLLNGNSVPSGGEVLVNGINLHLEKKKTEGIIGYIPQDDLLIEDLTVFQNLFYNAKLCFAGMDDGALTKKAVALLENLGLAETSEMKVGNVLEKTISGGQRKRLNIALELIREPSVLFVDEPTSGLSSRDSENVMDLLKQLSLTGKLVIVVIHQPSSDIFKLFDKLLLLDIGGYPVYYGNPSESLIYFKRLAQHADADTSECETCGNINPEQIFSILEAKVLDEYGQIQTERKVSPAEWNSYFKKNFIPVPTRETNVAHGLNHRLKESSAQKPSRWKQFKVFLTRDVLSKISNKQYILINLLEAPLLAAILSYLIRYQKSGAEYVFRDNVNLPAYLFMAVIVALFLGLTVSAEEIFRDRKILKRESFLNLSRASYLSSKTAIMFLISAIQSFLFVIVGNSIFGVKGMYLDYWLIMFSTSCFANLLGLNISSAFNSAVTIYILVPLLIIPQLLLSGVIVKFDKLNPHISSQAVVPVMGDLMASRWAFEALAVNQYKNNEYEKHFFDLDKRMSHASYRSIFLIGRMEDKLQFCEEHLKSGNRDKEFNSSLELLHEELKREMDLNHNSSYDTMMNGLTPELFSTTIADKTREYLKALKKYYVDEFNSISTEKDSRVLALQPEQLKQAKRNYTNDALDELVLNKNDQMQIAEKGNRFIQHYQPVYMDGDKRTLLRANFYASRKNIFGNYVETFWANTAVIWLMTLLLTIALYFDWFRKAVKKIAN